MDALVRYRARVGNHNPRLVYLDPADKPEDERGGGPETMAAVITWQSPEHSIKFAEWLVETINERLDEIRSGD